MISTGKRLKSLISFTILSSICSYSFGDIKERDGLKFIQKDAIGEQLIVDAELKPGFKFNHAAQFKLNAERTINSETKQLQEANRLIHRYYIELPKDLPEGTFQLQIDYQACYKKEICFTPKEKLWTFLVDRNHQAHWSHTSESKNQMATLSHSFHLLLGKFKKLVG